MQGVGENVKMAAIEENTHNFVGITQVGHGWLVSKGKTYDLQRPIGGSLDTTVFTDVNQLLDFIGNNVKS